MKTPRVDFLRRNFKSKPTKSFGSSVSLYDAHDCSPKPYMVDRFNGTRQNSEVSGGCRSPDERRLSPTGSIISTQSQSQLTPSKQMTDAERLRKVVIELVETERAYVKHLNNLLQNYLEPLRNAAFLSSAEVSALFGNIQEIVAFQRLFLQSLQEAVEIDSGFYNFEHPHEFKDILFSIGSAFLYYASQFKLYSSFCASHSKAQKVLHPNDGNQALQEFLMSRNPRQQHSYTLESYLIKPIQRILKYPLLLQQLKAITDPGSEEHRHLMDALKVMEKVAEHINEMQRIHEEYGAIFDHLFRQHQKSCKHNPLLQPIDLSPADLLYYGGVEWLNISDFLGKIKKGLELHAMCFVFKTAVVFLCKERLRQKKKLMGGSNKTNSSEVEIIRYQVLIPVTEVQVRASSMKDVDNHFLWELIHLKSQAQRRSEKVYHLSNSTSEFRNAFLRTIRQIIRESVRNMSIPLNKPGLCSAPVLKAPIGGNRMNTHTLQSRAPGKKRAGLNPTTSLQRPTSGKSNYDAEESYDNVPETQPSPYSETTKPQRAASESHQHQRFIPESFHQKRSSLQHQAQQGNTSGSSYDSDQSANFRTRSRTVPDAMDELSDSTTKSDIGLDEPRSEVEDDPLDNRANGLGHTPNHLSLSTTSTLSTGSTGSQARLIHASNQPANYQSAKSLGSSPGSPIWKPREDFGSTQSVQSVHHGSTTSLSSRYSTRSQQNQGTGYLPCSSYSINAYAMETVERPHRNESRSKHLPAIPRRSLRRPNTGHHQQEDTFDLRPMSRIQISRCLSKTTVYSSMDNISEYDSDHDVQCIRSSSTHSVLKTFETLRIPPRRYHRPS